MFDLSDFCLTFSLLSPSIAFSAHILRMVWALHSYFRGRFVKVPSQKLLRPNQTVGLCLDYGRIWSDFVGFRRISSDFVGFCRIWSDLVGFCWIWSDLVGFCRILSDLVRLVGFGRSSFWEGDLIYFKFFQILFYFI